MGQNPGQNLSIFTIGENAAEYRQTVHGGQGGSNLFDIRVDENKSTTFIIRLVPWAANIANSKVLKYFYAVPSGNGDMIYDSMTTFNKPLTKEYHFCPISDLWAKLNGNPDPNVKKIAEQLRRQVRMVHYVQVVNAPDKPDLNNKFMPFHMPIDMDKLLRELAEPNEAQKALGAVPILAEDIYKGVDITCTITGHKPFANGPVMRKWSLKPSDPKPMRLPLGPNGTLVPVTELSQDQILGYFTEQQSIDILQAYGHTPPNFETEIAAYHWCSQVCSQVPGMQVDVDRNFPHVVEHLNKASLGTMAGGANAPIATETKTYSATESAGNPMMAEAPQATQATEAPQATQATESPQATQATEAPQATQATEASASQDAPIVIP